MPISQPSNQCECQCPLYRGIEWFCPHGQRFVFIPVKRDASENPRGSMFQSEQWVRATNRLGPLTSTARTKNIR